MNRRRLFLVTIGLLFFLIHVQLVYANPSDILWIKSYNSGFSDFAYGAAVDSENNVIVTGTSGASGVMQYYTIKYNSAGDVLWSVRDIGSGYYDWAWDVATDLDKNVIVTGVRGGGYGSNSDIYTIKYNSSGGVLWTEAYDYQGIEGEIYGDVGRGVATDSNNNVIVGGRTSKLGGGESISLVIKYDAAGNDLWAIGQLIPGESAYANDVTVDNNNDIICTGTPLTQKLDSDGNGLWGQPASNGMGVASDSNDNVIVVGGSTGDKYVKKYDSSGALLWNIIYDGSPEAVITDYNNNIIVTGFSPNDYYTTVYDPSGEILWSKRFGSALSVDQAYSVAVDRNNDIIVTGNSDIDGTYDYYTVKYEGYPIVPEPQSLILLGIGLMGIFPYIRQRRK